MDAIVEGLVQNLYGQPLGKRFDQSNLNEERKISNSNSLAWIQGITINAHKQILDENNANHAYIHACKLNSYIKNFFQWLLI